MLNVATQVGVLTTVTVEPLNDDTLKSGHLSNQDTSEIRTLIPGPKCVHIQGFHCTQCRLTSIAVILLSCALYHNTIVTVVNIFDCLLHLRQIYFPIKNFHLCTLMGAMPTTTISA